MLNSCCYDLDGDHDDGEDDYDDDERALSQKANNICNIYSCSSSNALEKCGKQKT